MAVPHEAREREKSGKVEIALFWWKCDEEIDENRVFCPRGAFSGEGVKSERDSTILLFLGAPGGTLVGERE